MFICAVAAVAQKSPAGGGDPDAIGPAFEVASVRPSSTDGPGGFGMGVEPSGRFRAHAESIDFLFREAYQVDSGKSNVTVDRGAPKWVGSDLFDINATVDEAYKGGWDKLSDEQRMDRVRPMLRRLLADRFHLKMRVEMRKTPVYVLVQAKGGAHVKEVPPPVRLQGDPTEATARWMADHPGKAAPGSINCDSQKCIGNAAKFGDVIGQIAIGSGADRMVIDETELKGYYDFSVVFAVPPGSDETPMQAVEDGWGVRFEPRSVPVKTYVIEWADKPSVDGA
jgi:uncharacterized protein (TIGR03435 family)